MTNENYTAYWSNNWNRLDAFVVMVSLLAIIFQDVKIFRSLRAVRPLRVAVRSKQVKVVVSTLLAAILPTINILVFCLFFWLVFAILGVNLYSGKIHMCDDASEEFEDEWNVSKEECIEAGGSWQYGLYNFNDVFQGMRTIFVLATCDNWNSVMYSLVDGTDDGIVRDNNQWAAVFSILVVIIAGYFSLNLVVSCIADEFAQIRKEKDGSAFMTDGQADWVRTKRVIQKFELEIKAPKPTSFIGTVCYRIVLNPNFDPFITSCIILNTLTMCMRHYGMSDGFKTFLSVADITFVAIFTLEAILEIKVFGWKLYWRDNWNRFDFFVVIMSYPPFFIRSDTNVSTSVIRVFRIGRILRLINKAKGLKLQFNTLLYSIPSLWNIGALLFIIFFIYAVIGVGLFGEHFDNGDINKFENFETFPNAFLVLWISATGEWMPYYSGMMREHGTFVPSLYFMSFCILGSLVAVNLFIGVILEMFHENNEDEEKDIRLQTVYNWRDLWNACDPGATGELSAETMLEILSCTPEPAGLLPAKTYIKVLKKAGEEVDWNINNPLQRSKRVPAIMEQVRKLNALPKREEILNRLGDLKLLVHKTDGKETVDDGADSGSEGCYGDSNWIVRYEEALLAISTHLVGPEIKLKHETEKNIYIKTWYQQYG